MWWCGVADHTLVHLTPGKGGGGGGDVVCVVNVNTKGGMCHVTVCTDTPPASPHLTSPHLTLPYLTSPHLTLPYLTLEERRGNGKLDSIGKIGDGYGRER